MGRMGHGPVKYVLDAEEPYVLLALCGLSAIVILVMALFPGNVSPAPVPPAPACQCPQGAP